MSGPQDTETHRSELRGSWLSGLAVVIGLVGVVVAILAILRSNGVAESISAKLKTALEEVEQVKRQATAASATPGPNKDVTTPVGDEVEIESQLGTSVLLPTSAAPATKEDLEAEAEFVVNRLAAFLPGEARALHVKAMLFAQLHRTQEALQLWTECIQLDAAIEPYYVILAAIAIDRGEIDLAIDTLQSAKAAGQ